MNYHLTYLAFLFCSLTTAQNLSKQALFLGNSYTGVNNLPQTIANVAASVGDTLIYDSNTPGGYTLQGHSTNTTSSSKIALGNWDFVVLQEQSQLPSFTDADVEIEVFPYAKILDSIVNFYNPCGETVFYMTWGRKNGDASNCASWPPVCTYSGMDSLLNLRYRIMADSNNAILSPVGEVWKYLRLNFPLIELYQADESHPSIAGTYAAACSFYAVLFRKNPALLTFNPGLSATDAENIRLAAKLIVFDSLLNWHVGEYDSILNASCAVNVIQEKSNNVEWNFYPNPTLSTLTFNFTTQNYKKQIQIYNSFGILLKELEAYPYLQINVADLPNGLYYIRVKNQQMQIQKFIKQ